MLFLKRTHMKKLKFLSTALLFSASLNATTIYYNGENNDIGAWSIGPNSLATSALTEVHDDTLNSTVMSFTDGGQYRLRLPGNAIFWENTTERILSLDMNLDSDFTLDVFVQTNQGLRQLFFNRLNLNAGHHNSGILGGIGHNRLFRTGANNSGWGNHPEHRNNRNGWVRVTLDLERQLRDIEPDNRVVSVLSLRIAGTSGRIDNVTLDRPNRITMAGTDGDWRRSENVPIGGTLDGLFEGDRGEIIEFRGVANSNSFSTGARVGNDSWNDSVHDIIQWQMQTEEPYKFIVHVNTTNGLRDMVYHGGKQRAENDEWWLRPLSAIEERGLEAENNEIYIGLGIRRHLGDDSPDTDNNGIADYDSGTGSTWQTFTRNLATDVAEFENGNRLISINGVTVIGTNTFEHNSPMIESTIKVDAIQLFTSIQPTGENPPPATDEEATDLHQWQLRDNSVRISFRDNATDESGFSFINADTGENMNRDLAPLNGTGLEGIGQLNGLTAGTTYQIQVQTNFDDGRESVLSEPISITTTGDAPDEDENDEAQPATNLHQWQLRDNSVRISFVDNATGESGFSFINADNNQQLSENLPAIEGRGGDGIGQINGLISGTTYRVRVRTNFTNGQTPLLSEALQFTTTGTPPPPPNSNEEATNLHRWRLRENSVRISFVDNANGEIGFRYINADTGIQMGNPLPATSGMGQSSIGQINGLTEGTTYHIQVQTLFNDGRATATSETLTFRTLGDAPNNNEDAATNLHTWRLRATSVKISFNDNAQGETGFRFINADTNAQLGNTLPARGGTGSSNIGRVNGLTPATTYRVRVETLFNNGHQNTLSEIIEFRTPSQ
jgi:hypothetical protein